MIINWSNSIFVVIFCGSSLGSEPPDYGDGGIQHYLNSSSENPAVVTGDEGSLEHFICDSTDALYHQWYHGYVIDTELKEITIIPLQAAVKRTHYLITLEKFDDNTGIYCMKQTYIFKYEHLFFKRGSNYYYFTGIMVPSETHKSTVYSAILKYSENKNALFSCENYANGYVHVGIINILSNSIIPYNRQSIETYGNFDITNSRKTVLCCIYYEMIGNEEETWITRQVTDKTLLIHDDDKRSPSLDNVPSSPPPRPPQITIYPSTIVHPSYNNKQETNQNITCIHRYQNVTGNQQKEIASYSYNVPIEHKINRSFIITVEEFDDNTEIYCVKDKNESLLRMTSYADIGDRLNVFNFSTNSSLSKTILKVIRTQTKIEEIPNLKYNETKNVTFSCPEQASKKNYVQLGVINKTSNMIKTSLETTMNQTFNITHNGAILCCIYYVNYESNTTRFVMDKTLLVYDGTQNGHSEDPKDTDNIDNDANTNAHEAAASQTKIYKTITAVFITVLILLIVVFIWIRCCRKKPKSNHKVLYAELDHVRQTVPDTSAGAVRPRPKPEEESPYAQIIGEMRPQ